MVVHTFVVCKVAVTVLANVDGHSIGELTISLSASTATVGSPAVAPLG